MNDIFLSYDLKKAGRNYNPLGRNKALGGVGCWSRVWQFQSASTALQVRNHFQEFVDGNDGLLVMNVNDWAALRLVKQPDHYDSQRNSRGAAPYAIPLVGRRQEAPGIGSSKRFGSLGCD